MAKFDMEADHGSHEESWANHRLQGLQATPKSPDQPNIFLYLTFKNMAAYGGNIGDKGIEEEYVAKKVIGSTEFQNKKRVERSEYRKVLGIELIREIILK